MPICINMILRSCSLLMILFPISIFGQALLPVNTSNIIFDTCRTHLYYQQIGTAGIKKQINKARTVQDDGILSVGYTEDAVSKDGLIIKQDRDGNITWQKRFGLPGYDEQFTGFGEFRSGDILAIGTIRDKATLREGLMFCRISSTGNLIWQTTYSNFQATRNIHNGKVYINTETVTPDIDAFFAAESDSAIIYGMINASGNLLWQKAIRSSASTSLVDVSGYAYDLLIATNSIDTAHHIVKTYFIPYYQYQTKTITASRRFGGNYNNSSYILHDMEQSDLYSYFSGIRSVGGQPYEVIRLNINQGRILQSMENIVTPGWTIDSTARSAISIYGDCISFTPAGRSTDIGLIKMTGSYNLQSYTYWSAKATLTDTIELNGCAKTWDAGYNIYGNNYPLAGNKKIIQVKIDSAALLPSCVNRQQQNFSVQRDNSSFSDTAAYTYVSDSLVLFNTPSTPVSDLLADTLIQCKELKCPEMAVPDTCVNSFFRLYRGYSVSDIPGKIQELNGSFYTSATTFEMYYHPNFLNTSILKFNSDGHISRQRIIGIENGNNARFSKTIDNALLLYGTYDSLYNYYPFVAKLDTNMNILWVKTIPFAFSHTSGGRFGIDDVQQAADGNYYLIANEYTFPFDNRSLLIKLDVNGNFVWSKIYRFTPPPGFINLITGRKLLLDNTSAYITCSNDYNDLLQTILLKADLATGNIAWCKKFDGPDDRVRISTFLSRYNNELYFSGYGGAYPHKNILLKTNLNGDVVKVKSHSIPSVSAVLVYQTAQHTDGSLSLTTAYSPTDTVPYYLNGRDCFVKLNSDLEVIYSKKQELNRVRERKDVVCDANGILYETGYGMASFNDPYYDYHPYLVKYSAEGKVGLCPSDTFEFNQTSLPITTSPVSFVVKDTVFPLRVPSGYTRQHYLAEYQLICSSVTGCDTLKILGEDTICSKLPVYTYTLHKNTGCNAPVLWSYDQTAVQLIYADNNSISLRFLRSGSVQLKATLYSDCMPVSDSLNIHIYSSRDTLDLGPDTILCNGASLILKAGAGFKTYTWQDGSSDSIFVAAAAGTYYVTVTDSCNNVFSDTIHINPDTYTPFDLGNDTTKCNKDSILLQINPGFLNYTWSPVINMIPVSATAVRVFPAASMFYYVAAAKLNGCLVKDSIYITVNQSPPINLGPDVSLCMGDSLQLNAGNGFSSYLWSTGQVTPAIFVNNTGTFYVTATDMNNCRSADTLKVLQLLPRPDVALSNDTGICSGQQKILDAGPGFNTYLWNTGSNMQKITVITTGTFWVRVTDNNGCKGSDTARIDHLFLPPSSFILFRDTSVCRYDSIRLIPTKAFTNYLWNTGSLTPAITVTNPGVYWLQVTDENGCKGSDTTTVLAKNCLRGIYFPNSFTPNRDGLNDLYKPTVFGYLDYYIIRIFNRWGQKVFESNDPLRGWNGQSGSKLLDQGAFTWICVYRFKGGKTETEQGSLLLLK